MCYTHFMLESEITQLEHDDLKIEGSGENLSSEATAKAEVLARMVQDAQEKGDGRALQVLAESVRNDPELSQALERRREDDKKSQETESIDLVKINQALEELNNGFTRIAQLSAQAMETRAVTESLFNNDDERSAVIAKVEALNSAVSNATSYDQVQEALDIFKSWYDKSQPVIVERTKAKVRYFGGSLPDRLLVQVRMFDKLKGDLDNMRYYLDLTKK